MSTRLALSSLLLLSLPLAAHADDLGATAVSRRAFSISVGGGVTGFLADTPRDSTSVGGEWEARVGFAPASDLMIEAGYVGTAQPLDALGSEDDAVLVGTGLELAARLNFLTGAIRPFALVGGGWTRYDVTRTDITSADVAEEDDVFHAPVGIGVDYRIGRLVLDVRAMFRAAVDSDLFATAGGDEDAGRLDRWSAALRLGFEI